MSYKLYGVLSNLAYKKHRPKKLWGYEKEEETPEHVLYHNPTTKHSIISIRGTDNLDDVLTDIQTPFKDTQRHKKELDFYDEMNKKYKNISLTGHSLGGNLADYITKQRKNTNSVVFNPFIIGDASTRTKILKTPLDPASILTSSEKKSLIGQQKDKSSHTINQFAGLIEE